MSWDLMILAFDPAWSNAEDIPDDWKPGVIGPRATVVAAVAEVFPDATEDGDGRFETEGGSADIWAGLEDPSTR